MKNNQYFPVTVCSMLTIALLFIVIVFAVIWWYLHRLDNAIPGLMANGTLHRLDNAIHSTPIRDMVDGQVSSIYNESNRLKIAIAIPSTCGQKESNLRRVQRESWLKYLDSDNELWHSMHSQCTISYRYYIGNCPDSDAATTSLLERESVEHGDIVRLDMTERWEDLQQKTIQIIIAEYVRGTASTENGFDILMKTDTDSFVNLPNLCDLMTNLMNSNSWNGQQDALYLGRMYQGVPVRRHGRYGNPQWAQRIGGWTYCPYMAGFGYMLSTRTTEIIYKSLVDAQDEMVFNRMEDAFLGHFLTSFAVKFLDLTATIINEPEDNGQSLDRHVVNHRFIKSAMIKKYEDHCAAQMRYIKRS